MALSKALKVFAVQMEQALATLSSTIGGQVSRVSTTYRERGARGKSPEA